MLADHLCEPMQTLISETDAFADPDHLYQELERVAFECLERKVNIDLALRVLFHLGDAAKLADEDIGTLSVFFDSEKLLDLGCPSASARFTKAFNEALIHSEDKSKDDVDTGRQEQDAFGRPSARFRGSNGSKIPCAISVPLK